MGHTLSSETCRCQEIRIAVANHIRRGLQASSPVESSALLLSPALERAPPNSAPEPREAEEALEEAAPQPVLRAPWSHHSPTCQKSLTHLVEARQSAIPGPVAEQEEDLNLSSPRAVLNLSVASSSVSVVALRLLAAAPLEALAVPAVAPVEALVVPAVETSYSHHPCPEARALAPRGPMSAEADPLVPAVRHLLVHRLPSSFRPEETMAKLSMESLKESQCPIGQE